MYDDYRGYLFNTLGVREGDPAPNWKRQLEDLVFALQPPFGKNVQEGTPIPLTAPHHGIAIMIDGGNNARGRIWLPCDDYVSSDGNDWYTHEIQVIANGPQIGSIIWAWQDKGGATVRPFSGAAPGPGPGPTPPPTGDYVTQAEMDAAIAAAVAECLKRGDEIGLKTMPWNGRPGKFVCADHDQKDHLIANRDNRGAWETYVID